MKRRFFKYIDPDVAMTRGDFGVQVVGGHNSPDDPEAVWVFDPDFGDTVVCSIEYALGAGWVEITQEEHKKL